jgi:hypothetical protein
MAVRQHICSIACKKLSSNDYSDSFSFDLSIAYVTFLSMSGEKLCGMSTGVLRKQRVRITHVQLSSLVARGVNLFVTLHI